jgi:hypothetical protein
MSVSIAPAAHCTGNPWSCGWDQPANPSPVLAHIAYTAGYWFIPALLVAAVIIAVIVAGRRNGRNRRVARETA